MKNITKFKSKHLLEVNAENTGNPVNLNVKRFILRAKTRLIRLFYFVSFICHI